VWDGSGLMANPAHHSRLRGNTARFTKASELFLVADAAPRSDGGWTLFCDADGELTLRDVFVSTYGPPNNPRSGKNAPGGSCAAWDLFDMTRHRGRINVGFADGHVESVMLTEGDLAKISLNKGFPAIQ
jgi:prepilin-type processing-associated H-X9-DG protein